MEDDEASKQMGAGDRERTAVWLCDSERPGPPDCVRARARRCTCGSERGRRAASRSPAMPRAAGALLSIPISSLQCVPIDPPSRRGPAQISPLMSLLSNLPLFTI
ncbi:hypothetical protein ABZP36_026172 [Zizania latifolia]